MRRFVKPPIFIMILLLHLLALSSLTDAAHSRKRVVSSSRRTDSEEESSYDRSITTFDPSGRLLQVEYGLAATLRGESVTAVWLPPPVNAMLVFVSRTSSKSSSATTATAKVHRLDHHLWLFTAGLAGDARALASTVRQQCLQHRLLQYGEAMTVQEAAQTVADLQHQLTRGRGVRPLGCTAIVLGMDYSSNNNNSKQQHKPRIFRTDPGGILEDCLYCCAGKEQEQLIAALAEPYENLVSKLSSESSSSSTTRISIQDAIQQLLSVLREKDQNGNKIFDIWLFRPNSNRRGKVHATCFSDVGSLESMSQIEAYFEKDRR